jgi:hypothetical protein
MNELGKLLVVLGVLCVLAGFIVILIGRTHLPIGRLPGDIVYRGKNTTIYFPLASSILLSIVLSIILYAVNHWRK